MRKSCHLTCYRDGKKRLEVLTEIMKRISLPIDDCMIIVNSFKKTYKYNNGLIIRG